MARGVRDGKISFFFDVQRFAKLFCNRLQQFETVRNNLGGQTGFGNSLKQFATVRLQKTRPKASKHA